MKSFPSRCCQVFSIPAHSEDELRQEFKGWFKKRDAEALRTIQLLIPIRYEGVDMDLFETLEPRSQEFLKQGGTMWSCRYFDSCSGECGVYDNRPDMCRKFPDNDTDNRDSNGTNLLCLCCTSTYCGYHPESVTSKEVTCAS
jgi:Fe-S-cluster containining protein